MLDWGFLLLQYDPSHGKYSPIRTHTRLGTRIPYCCGYSRMDAMFKCNHNPFKKRKTIAHNQKRRRPEHTHNNTDLGYRKYRIRSKGKRKGHKVMVLFCGDPEDRHGCGCDFHSSGHIHTTGAIPEAERRARIAAIMGSENKVGLVSIDTLTDTSADAPELVPGELRLLQFLRMLNHISYNAPWANKHFAVNASILKRLVINHMSLIVGADAAHSHGEHLATLVADSGLKSQNLVWITNRQQVSTPFVQKGKTSRGH